MSATVKALLSGDTIGVNVKNGPMVTHVYRSAVFWGTNVPPQFREASRALENRLLIVKCKKEFDPTRPSGVAKIAIEKGCASPSELILSEEKSGVLRWAVEGLRRAWDRGYIEMTAEVKESLREMHLDSNVAARFFEECVEFSPHHMIPVPDLYAAFSAWWTENSEKTVPSPKVFGKAVISLDARIVSGGNLKHKMIRQTAGIKMTDTGLDYWQAQFNAQGIRGGNSDRISASAADVNTPIPDTWDKDPRILLMRKIFETLGEI
jgi:phage/plasmid-associated DNA primase